ADKAASARRALDGDLEIATGAGRGGIKLLPTLIPEACHDAFLSPGFSFKNRGLPNGASHVTFSKRSPSRLKRDHQVVLPTQARAPGFRVELRGTTFRLVATG